MQANAVFTQVYKQRRAADEALVTAERSLARITQGLQSFKVGRERKGLLAIAGDTLDQEGNFLSPSALSVERELAKALALTRAADALQDALCNPLDVRFGLLGDNALGQGLRKAFYGADIEVNAAQHSILYVHHAGKLHFFIVEQDDAQSPDQGFYLTRGLAEAKLEGWLHTCSGAPVSFKYFGGIIEPGLQFGTGDAMLALDLAWHWQPTTLSFRNDPAPELLPIEAIR